jgi:excisionase family DNA binding protein
MSTILTPEQAADQLQVSRRTVYTLLRQGKLPGKKLGGSWRLSATALEQFLSQPDPQMPTARITRVRSKPPRKARSLK